MNRLSADAHTEARSRWLGHGAARALATALVTLALAACGVGGEGTGGTTAVQQVTGRVEGFGSVQIAGQRYADEGAELVETLDPREPVARPLGEVRLGHQVTLLARPGAPARLLLAPVVVGAVEAVNLAAGRIGVAGQTVLVDTAPAEPTVLEGFESLGDLRVESLVVVHGQRDALDRVIATRVERRERLPGERIDGTVAEIDRASATVRIGERRVAIGRAARAPEGYEPQLGDRVVAFGPLATTGSPLQAQVLQAAAPTTAPEGELRLRGPLTRWDPGSAQATVAGVRVDLSALSTAERQALAPGALLLVVARARDRGWTADRIERLDPELPLRAEVEGRVGGIVDGRRFELRGVAIDATGARFEALDEDNLASGVALRARGRVSATGLLADAVTSGTLAPDAPAVQAGPVASWSPTTRLLRLDGSPTAFRVAADARVVGGTLDALIPGRKVVLRGRVQGAETLVTEVDLADPLAVVQLSGVAGNVEADPLGGGAFEIGAVDLFWNGSTRFLGATNSVLDLRDGRFIRIRGERQGGRIVVSEVDARATQPGTVRLRGTVTGLSAPGQFRVDAQRIDASRARFEPPELRESLAGAYLDIEGSLVGGVVQATLVRDP